MNRAGQRIRVVGELSQVRTLVPGPAAFTRLGEGADVLLLGLGPQPAALAAWVEGARTVRYVEAPEFERQMPAGWGGQIPAGWQRIAPESVTDRIAAESRIYCHNPNRQLFPSFWGPLWAQCLHVKLAHGRSKPGDGPVWIPSAGAEPLVPELAVELRRAGVPVRILPPAGLAKSLRRLLGREVPRCFVSVNLAGLDAYGEAFHLLSRAGVPVAAWFVDNPFHLLTRIRAPFWKSLHLFVTDPWFVAPLRGLGAERAECLPLAVCPAVFHPRGSIGPSRVGSRMVFVGHSRFRSKERYFSGCRIPEDRRRQARQLMKNGFRPDYAWWLAASGQERFWPGRGVRSTGCAAEDANQTWRAFCLSQVSASQPLTVFGDRGWADMLPQGVDLRAPVDYYRQLPGIYAAASYTLNLTSLLLPCGLNQRHFDVWAAGGFLVSDRTPGLSLFPRELTDEIAFDRPEEVARIVNRLDSDPRAKAQLRKAWEELILEKHTYNHRIREMFDRIGVCLPSRPTRRKASGSDPFGKHLLPYANKEVCRDRESAHQ